MNRALLFIGSCSIRLWKIAFPKMAFHSGVVVGTGSLIKGKAASV